MTKDEQNLADDAGLILKGLNEIAKRAKSLNIEVSLTTYKSYDSTNNPDRFELEMTRDVREFEITVGKTR